MDEAATPRREPGRADLPVGQDAPQRVPTTKSERRVPARSPFSVAATVRSRAEFSSGKETDPDAQPPAAPSRDLTVAATRNPYPARRTPGAGSRRAGARRSIPVQGYPARKNSESSPPAPEPVADEWIDRFVQHLTTDRHGSDYTVRNYTQALHEFHRWHERERGAAPDWPRLERDDFRAYLRYLGRNRLSRAAT